MAKLSDLELVERLLGPVGNQALSLAREHSYDDWGEIHAEGWLAFRDAYNAGVRDAMALPASMEKK